MWPFKRRSRHVYVAPPRSPEAASALTAIWSVPGPSPWHLRFRVAEIPYRHGTLTWKEAPAGPNSAGKSLLVTSKGRVVAIADFHC